MRFLLRPLTPFTLCLFLFLPCTAVISSWKYDDLMQFINDELIQRNKTLVEMGEAVLEESISRAITNFGAKHYDDACLVVWQFTPSRAHGSQQQQQQQSPQSQQQQQTGEATLANGVGSHDQQQQQQQQSAEDAAMSN